QRVQAAGLIIKQLAAVPSNWRSQGDLRSFLQNAGTVAIEGIDTRALTRHLRTRGGMLGCLTTELDRDEALQALAAAPDYAGIDFARRVTTQAPYVWPAEKGSQQAEGAGSPSRTFRVALIDCGVKRNIMRRLAARGCETTVVPCTTSADEILALEPDGIA